MTRAQALAKQKQLRTSIAGHRKAILVLKQKIATLTLELRTLHIPPAPKKKESKK